MTIANVFENLVHHYHEAEKVTPDYYADNIFRGRQASISSISEDLFAFFLREHLRSRYKFPIYFMIDYPIKPEKAISKMCPDIAIIIREAEPVLASYIDVKMDLGYQRDFFNSFPIISSRVKELRDSHYSGTQTQDGAPVLISKKIKWRTVVFSKKNSDGQHFDRTQANALAIADEFELYFLSHKQHPNTKKFLPENILLENVEKLLRDIESDIEAARN